MSGFMQYAQRDNANYGDESRNRYQREHESHLQTIDRLMATAEPNHNGDFWDTEALRRMREEYPVQPDLSYVDSLHSIRGHRDERQAETLREAHDRMMRDYHGLNATTNIRVETGNRNPRGEVLKDGSQCNLGVQSKSSLIDRIRQLEEQVCNLEEELESERYYSEEL